jgi:hypothetical protein
MQGAASQSQPTPIWLPPIQADWLVAIILIIVGSNIEQVPEKYQSTISNPLVFLVGMLVSAGVASLGHIPISFAIAFCLVNLIRIMPKPKKPASNVGPGAKKVSEGFTPSGTIDWVTTHKKWFVEKVLMEQPVAIQEKEAITYPIQA